MDIRKYDLIDLACVMLVVWAIASNGNPLSAVVFIPLWLAQHFIRRADFVKAYLQSTSIGKLLIPPPTSLIPIVPEKDEEPFWKGITEPLKTTTDVAAHEPILLQRIPREVSLDSIPQSQTKLAVPIGFGIDHKRNRRWFFADFGSSTIHALIAGSTGSGKDTILKLWFVALTRQNAPHELKFVVLDGKGEWVIPPLINAQHMFYKPSGGLNMVQELSGKRKIWVDKANEDIEDAIGAVFTEIARRTQLFQMAGVANVERYREKTGLPLPTIIVYATDVGTNIKALEQLINALVSKGRSLGIRIVISMQTSSNQSTFWRSNLGLVISGNLQLDSQDSPVLGIKVDDMFFRPSKLPSPKARAGIFVVRDGDYQYVVQVPYLADNVFEDYISYALPQKQPLLAKSPDEALRKLLQ